MKSKILKLLKIFLVCSLIISNVKFIDLYHTGLEVINKKEDKINSLENNTKSLNQEIESLKKTNEETNKEKELKDKELENLKENYDELEKKYLEEMKRVSFNPNNLWEKSNATVNNMKVALAGTQLQDLAYAYVKAEKEWGVNAIFLASLTAEESGWGTSYRAKYQNNLSGYAVYSSGAEGRYFGSKEESIMETAKLICKEYLKPTGAYYSGISIYNVNTRYCPNDGGKWASNISSIAYSLVEKINNR